MPEWINATNILLTLIFFTLAWLAWSLWRGRLVVIPASPRFRYATRDDASEATAEEEALYARAREVTIETQKASAPHLQRCLGLGYARAARMIDLLEERGVIGAGRGGAEREVLLPRDRLWHGRTD